jgi:hypothetical protein
VLREIISNSRLSEHFLALARDLDVMEPKVPEDVYKTHLTGATAACARARACVFGGLWLCVCMCVCVCVCVCVCARARAFACGF